MVKRNLYIYDNRGLDLINLHDIIFNESIVPSHAATDYILKTLNYVLYFTLQKSTGK